MKNHTTNDSPGLAALAVAGLAGGLLGSLAMNLFGRLAVTVGGGREAPGAAPGADRAGRGVQPPQSEGTADDDAAVRAGSAVYRAATGDEPDRHTQRQLGTAAHYAFGAGAGLAYGLLSGITPAVRGAAGLLYGTAVWAIADEGIMPALGLSRGPRRLSPGVHAYALAGHFVYGATLDAILRSVQRPHR